MSTNTPGTRSPGIQSSGRPNPESHTPNVGGPGLNFSTNATQLRATHQRHWPQRLVLVCMVLAGSAIGLVVGSNWLGREAGATMTALSSAHHLADPSAAWNATLGFDDWSSMEALEFCDAIQAAMSSDDPPDAASLAAAIDHAWSFLSDGSFMLDADNAVAVARLLGMFDTRFSAAQRNTLLGFLSANGLTMTAGLQAPTDSFHLLKAVHDSMKRLGGTSADLVDLTVAWADARPWQQLEVGPLAYLRTMLREDLGDRLQASARWRGSIHAPSGQDGQYLFSNMAGTSTTAHVQIYIDDQLVYGVNEDQQFVQEPVQLSAAAPSALRVELVNISPRITAADGYPVAILRWKRSDVQDSEWAVVPQPVLTPPQGMGDPGDGVLGEYFNDSGFEHLLASRIDEQVDFVWINDDFVSVYDELRCAVLDELWDKLVTGDYVADTQQHGPDNAYGPMTVLWLASGLRSEQRSELLAMIAQQQPVLQQVPGSAMAGYYFIAQYADDQPVNDLLGAWSQLHPVETAFGIMTGSRSYRVHNQMPYQWLGTAVAAGGAQRISAFSAHHLEAAGGACNRTAAQIAVHGLRAHGQTAMLDALLDDKLSDDSITGDARASWLLARAYAEEARTGGSYPLAGRAWLDEAIGEAVSEAMFHTAAHALIVRLAAYDQGEQALNIMQALPLPGDLVAEWSAHISAITAAYSQMEADAALARQEAYITDLEARLARAQDDGDQERITRYQSLLSQFN